MSLHVTEVALFPYALPLPAPIVTARVTRTERRGWLLRLTDERGAVGWGEATCWPGFGAGEAPTRRLLEAFVERPALLCDVDFPDLLAVSAWADDWKRDLPEALHAAETAVLDLLAQRQEVSLARLLHPHAADEVRVHTLVRDAAEAREAVARGATTLKLKLGRSVAEATQRVAAVREAAPDVRLRVDVNGGWDRATASAAIPALAPFGLEWVEQPLPADDVLGLARLRREGPIRIAVDETVALRDGVVRVIDAEAADVIVIKPVAVGGLLAARRLARLATEAGLEVCVTHCFGTGVERTAAAHLAAALPGVEACGLAPPAGPDLVAAPIVIADKLQLPRTGEPGLGVGVPNLAGVALAAGGRA